MEKKNNSLVIILMGVIIVILAVLCVLFSTGTINLKSDNNCIDVNSNVANTPNTNDELNNEDNTDDNVVENQTNSQENNSNTTVDSYLGKWYLDNSDSSYINILKNEDNSGYKVEIMVNKMADFKNLDLICSNNSGACYVYADENHSYSIMMAHNQIYVVPSERAATVGTYWTFNNKK